MYIVRTIIGRAKESHMDEFSVCQCVCIIICNSDTIVPYAPDDPLP